MLHTTSKVKYLVQHKFALAATCCYYKLILLNSNSLKFTLNPVINKAFDISVLQ